ncbi:uncharacterized protein LOC103488678 isoform X11 [Cucumis melo]|uniref:Uncharacterized protein LOC103488678 isoform X11 n=1 Tax=Cucumis melo TaxID=3656 RepID=A0A1S4DVY0_CUCME|nr:uncharacterized protein LOC103488678 isoform X11 [Cucumis melo]
MGHISWEKNHAVASDLLSRQVATFLLLLVLSGPVKALTYLLRHGLVGFTMGSLWRLGANWSTSIFLCTIVRAFGAVGYVLVSSFLIRENILSLITINIHASLTLIFTAWGVNLIPSMNAIYAIFGTLTWFEDFIDITTVAGKGNVNILTEANCKPMIRAWYSATLFEHNSPSVKLYGNICFLRDMKTMSTPASIFRVTPSKNMVQSSTFSTNNTSLSGKSSHNFQFEGIG